MQHMQKQQIRFICCEANVAELISLSVIQSQHLRRVSNTEIQLPHNGAER